MSDASIHLLRLFSKRTTWTNVDAARELALPLSTIDHEIELKQSHGCLSVLRIDYPSMVRYLDLSEKGKRALRALLARLTSLQTGNPHHVSRVPTHLPCRSGGGLPVPGLPMVPQEDARCTLSPRPWECTDLRDSRYYCRSVRIGQRLLQHVTISMGHILESP